MYSGTSVLDAGEQTGEKMMVERVLSPLDQREVGTIRGIALNVSLKRSKSDVCSSRWRRNRAGRRNWTHTFVETAPLAVPFSRQTDRFDST